MFSPPTAFAEVTSIGFAYACICGPYAPWRTLCQRCLAQADRSALHRLLYETQRRSGLLDEALATAQDLSALAKSSGDEAIHVSALSQIADIYQARGQFEEALRIRREEALPLFEKLGDMRERAVTITQIADILAAKGRLDETIAIYEREVFPAYRQLGDQQMIVHHTYAVGGRRRFGRPRLSVNRKPAKAEGPGAVGKLRFDAVHKVGSLIHLCLPGRVSVGNAYAVSKARLLA